MAKSSTFILAISIPTSILGIAEGGGPAGYRLSLISQIFVEPLMGEWLCRYPGGEFANIQTKN